MNLRHPVDSFDGCPGMAQMSAPRGPLCRSLYCGSYGPVADCAHAQGPVRQDHPLRRACLSTDSRLFEIKKTHKACIHGGARHLITTVGQQASADRFYCACGGCFTLTVAPARRPRSAKGSSPRSHRLMLEQLFSSWSRLLHLLGATLRRTIWASRIHGMVQRRRSCTPLPFRPPHGQPTVKAIGPLYTCTI